jgi:hypothetical protein
VWVNGQHGKQPAPPLPAREVTEGRQSRRLIDRSISVSGLARRIRARLISTFSRCGTGGVGCTRIDSALSLTLEGMTIRTVGTAFMR